MTNLHPDDVLKFAEGVLDTPIQKVTQLGGGATSTAWLLSGDSDQFVLRTTQPSTNRPITYRSEFRILNALRAKECPVPEPICTSFDNTAHLDDRVSAWAITRQIMGQALLKNQMSESIARELGEFLTQLHGLPCDQYGRLDEESHRISGQQTTPLEGIRARWCWAQLWPFDGRPLADHPVSQLAPDLAASLIVIEHQLSEFSQDSDAVLTHSDLYGEHIFVDGDSLSGVIDFGAAFIASREWDFAVLAHYHGWETVGHVLEGYTAERQPPTNLLQQTYGLALVVGLYKLDKIARKPALSEKTKHILTFITETLKHLLS